MSPRLLLTVGIGGALALLIPVEDVGWFAGAPLSRPVELVALVALIPLLAVRSVRRVILRESGPLVSERAGRVAAALVAIAIVAKLGLALAGEEVGWRACFRAVDVPTPAGECERSYDNPLAGGSVTRYDDRLDFRQADGSGPSQYLSGSSWNLGFFNSLRWSVADPPDYRERLPFTVDWTADADAAGEVEVTYVGEGEVTVGAESRRLPPSYAASNTVVLRDLPSSGTATIRFAFTPGAHATHRPYATFRLTGLEVDGPTALQTILGVAADAALVALLVALALSYVLLARRLAWHWIPALALALVLVLPEGEPHMATRAALALLVIVAALLVRPSLRALLFAGFAIVAVEAIAVGHGFAAWDSVLYRTAGNDGLTYESFAREILASGSLRGGEDVFYYQPGFRYILFGARTVLGDGDAVLSVVSMSAVSIGVVFAAGAACALAVRGAIGRLACFVAAACVLVPLNANLDLVGMIESGLSEWPTWAAIPVGVAMIALAPTRRWVLIATALLAACALVRTNLAPALLVAIAAGLTPWWRTDRRLVLEAAALAVGLLSLPLVHNLVYGGQFHLGTTSSDINVYLPADQLPQAIWDSEVRTMLERQVRMMLYASPEASSDVIRASLRLLQVGWLVATIAIFARWSRTSLAAKALMLTPALALAPLLVYEAAPYYPRHIVAGHILMATVLAVVVAPAFSPARRRFDVVFYAPWAAPLLQSGVQAATGGAETQAILLARGLAARGRSVALVVRDTEAGLPEVVDGMSIFPVGVTRDGRRSGPAWGPRYALSAVAALRRAPADRVIQFARGLETVVVGTVARAGGARFVYRSASMADFDHDQWTTGPINRAGFRAGVRLADEIIVQTAEQAEACRERFGRTPALIRSVTEVAGPSAKPADGFLWVGRMMISKRPEEYLALAQDLPEARFRLVAVPGELDEACLRERAKSIPNLEWLGPRPRSELLALMETAVALVSTSSVEGMPNVFLEAWARGVPTLALDVDPDRLIEREGLGFAVGGDRSELVRRAVELWTDDPERAAISRRCVAYVRREHGLDAALDRLEALLRVG